MNITLEYLNDNGLSPTSPERFWNKVLIGSENGGCWNWTGASKMPPPKNYGILSRGKKGTSPINAHVASWILNRGSIPKGMFVCHRCDNASCVRPDHLFLGTPQDNSSDMMNKRRYVMPKHYKGEQCGAHRLTTEQVLEIRKLWSTSKQTYKGLARAFKCSDWAIKCIVERRTWKHV